MKYFSFLSDENVGIDVYLFGISRGKAPLITIQKIFCELKLDTGEIQNFCKRSERWRMPFTVYLLPLVVFFDHDWLIYLHHHIIHLLAWITGKLALSLDIGLHTA